MGGEMPILRGWKEIEAYLGMGRKAIIRAGYPVRSEENSLNVLALRSELLAFAKKRKLAACCTQSRKAWGTKAQIVHDLPLLSLVKNG